MPGLTKAESSRISRHFLLAPALPMDEGQEDQENAKTSVANS